MITYCLVGGVYTETGSWSTGEVATITEPFAVVVDVSVVLPT